MCCVQTPGVSGGAQVCPARVYEVEAFIDCPDGSHFQAPAGGGIALGFDRLGHDLDAYVTVVGDGKYLVNSSPAR
jgi:hypothetical protein